MIDEEIEIAGIVEDVSVHIEETGFTVLELSCDDEFITVVGVLPEVAVGEKLTVRGNYDTHPLYGRQLKAKSNYLHQYKKFVEDKMYLKLGDKYGDISCYIEDEIPPALETEILLGLGKEIPLTNE